MFGVAFPTAVLGAWLGDPKNEMVAALFYGGAATVGGLAYNCVWWYGAYVARLTSPALEDRQRHAHTIAWGPVRPGFRNSGLDPIGDGAVDWLGWGPGGARRGPTQPAKGVMPWLVVRCPSS